MAQAGYADWRPIDPADLALKQSKKDPNADAEALFREERILAEQHGVSYPQNIVSEYVRLKIFTERGKEFGDILIPYFRKQNVFEVEGRTIHPDGTVIPLSKDSGGQDFRYDKGADGDHDPDRPAVAL